MGNWICHWTQWMRLALSIESNWVDAPLPLSNLRTEADTASEKQRSFRKPDDGQVQEFSNSDCNTPSSVLYTKLSYVNVVLSAQFVSYPDFCLAMILTDQVMYILSTWNCSPENLHLTFSATLSSRHIFEKELQQTRTGEYYSTAEACAALNAWLKNILTDADRRDDSWWKKTSPIPTHAASCGRTSHH